MQAPATLSPGGVKVELGKEYGYGKLIALHNALGLQHPRVDSLTRHFQALGIRLEKVLPPSGRPDGSDYWNDYGGSRDDYRWTFTKEKPCKNS